MRIAIAAIKFLGLLWHMAICGDIRHCEDSRFAGRNTIETFRACLLEIAVVIPDLTGTCDVFH